MSVRKRLAVTDLHGPCVIRLGKANSQLGHLWMEADDICSADERLKHAPFILCSGCPSGKKEEECIQWVQKQE